MRGGAEEKKEKGGEEEEKIMCNSYAQREGGRKRGEWAFRIFFTAFGLHVLRDAVWCGGIAGRCKGRKEEEGGGAKA